MEDYFGFGWTKRYAQDAYVYNVTKTVRSKAEASDASYSTYYPNKFREQSEENQRATERNPFLILQLHKWNIISAVTSHCFMVN